MSDAAQVRAVVRRILADADLECSTQRSLQQQAEEEMGMSLAPYKAIISQEVDAYLRSLDGQQSEDDFQQPATKKQKRVYISVSDWKGQCRVNLRQHYNGAEGQLLPGKKGISLSVQAWNVLYKGLQAAVEALEQKKEGFRLELGDSCVASVSLFTGSPKLDIRQWYVTRDGEQAPGKKGIGLTALQLRSLLDAVEEITAQMSGNMKRVEVIEFKGRRMLSLREFYEKDGELLPGKRGLALTADQAAQLARHAKALTQALTAQDIAASFELSSKRVARISAFKGRYSVDIREMYEKNGQQLPGSKGLSLSDAQWSTLTQHLPDLISAL